MSIRNVALNICFLEFPRDSETTATVNKPSVLESLKFYSAVVDSLNKPICPFFRWASNTWSSS